MNSDSDININSNSNGSKHSTNKHKYSAEAKVKTVSKMVKQLKNIEIQMGVLCKDLIKYYYYY